MDNFLSLSDALIYLNLEQETLTNQELAQMNMLLDMTTSIITGYLTYDPSVQQTTTTIDPDSGTSVTVTEPLPDFSSLRVIASQLLASLYCGTQIGLASNIAEESFNGITTKYQHFQDFSPFQKAILNRYRKFTIV